MIQLRLSTAEHINTNIKKWIYVSAMFVNEKRIQMNAQVDTVQNSLQVWGIRHVMLRWLMKGKDMGSYYEHSPIQKPTKMSWDFLILKEPEFGTQTSLIYVSRMRKFQWTFVFNTFQIKCLLPYGVFFIYHLRKINCSFRLRASTELVTIDFDVCSYLSH